MLRRTFPNIVFLDEFRQCQSPSQLLVPRVDGVWTVSSSVGYQALLFSRLLGSPASTELSNVADATTLEDFFARLGHRRSANVDADNFLAWLLERYLVPASLLTDGRWFHDYLQRRLDAARRASDPIDAFVPTADADRLMDAWIVKTPPFWRWYSTHKARMIRRSQSSSPISRRCGASATRCSNQRVGGSPRPFAWSSKPQVARVFGTERDNGTGRRRPRETCHRQATIRAIPTPPRPACASSTGSTLAAQNLNSGILPNGSSCGLVSRLAAAST